MLGNYYHHKYGVDTRSVRFPGIISSVTLPGGGTTDYAVEIYYEAIRYRAASPAPCRADVYMDMIYMPDALRACVELMEADPAKLVHRNSFNIASMSFTPEIICAEIRKRLPDFDDGPTTSIPSRRRSPRAGPIRWTTPAPARSGAGNPNGTFRA